MWLRRAKTLGIVSVLAFPFLIFAFLNSAQNMFVVVYEAAFQLLCLGALLRARRRSPAHLALLAAMTALIIADADFNIRTLVGYHEVGWVRYVGEGGYTLFTGALVVFVARCSQVLARDRRPLLLLGVGTAAISLALQGAFVIVHLEHSAIATIPFSRINYLVYSLLAAALAGLAVPFSLFTINSRTHLLLQSAICFMTFDLALRYKNSQVIYQYHSWAEAGWAAGMAALCLCIAAEVRRERPWWDAPQRIAPWNSMRVFVGGSVFAANLMVMVAVVLCNLFVVHNAFDLTAALGIVFFCWVASNSLAIVVAGQLQAIEESIPEAPVIQDDVSFATLKFTQVSQRAYLVEWDRMIAKYNVLVTQANAVLAQLMEKNREAALASMASQVAHDIGSPLSALTVALADTGELPEETRTLVRSAVHRIQDISHQLLERRRALQHDAEPQSAVRGALVSPLVDSVLSEKRTEYRAKLGLQLDMSLDAASYGVFATLDPGGFKAVLSNILNNALESVEAVGAVQVSIQRHGPWAQVLVRDDGRGMPAEVLAGLGRNIVTFGKAQGNGLGTYQATQQVESWGGHVHFCSQQGQGTAVRFHLPLAEPPPWFLPHIRVRRGTRVVVVDDDVTIHNIWRGRFGPDTAELTLHNLSTPAALEAWIAAHGCDGALFLMDYELLGCSENGLDLATRLGIAHQAVLVTSRFEEPQVVDRCVRAKMPLLPKSAAPIVPIRQADPIAPETARATDCVLIDDDVMMHKAWQLRARDAGKTLQCYGKPADFFQDAALYGRATPIYVDSELGYTLEGEYLAKTIKGMRFETVILATGHAPSDFTHCTWLDGVVGKMPPF